MAATADERNVEEARKHAKDQSRLPRLLGLVDRKGQDKVKP